MDGVKSLTDHAQGGFFDVAAVTERAGDDFSFTDKDFERVRGLLYQRAGIKLHSGKRAMVYGRLARRLRDKNMKQFSEYLDQLESSRSEVEWQEFINCLTTNVTSFFRESHHFDALAQELPHCKSRPIRIWCNAASTGEEPYTLAMTLIENLGPSPNAKLLCSDIDTNVLAKARRGVYSVDAGGLSEQRLKRFFMRGKGPHAGQMRVKPEVGKLVEFMTFNLMSTDWRSLGQPFDFVFCRNVMIYFDRATQRKVLEGIRRVMRPGGLLFVGHSENFTDSRDLVRLRGKTIYECV